MIRSIATAFLILASGATGAAAGYHIVDHIAGPDGRWDYATIDAAARRLYIGRQGGIMALDLDTGMVTPRLYASQVVHLALPVGGGRLLATTGDSNTAVLLDGSTGEVIASFATGAEPDGAAFDAATGLAITFNRRGLDTTIIDLNKLQVAGGFKLPGHAESGVADGHGTIYVNIASRGEIAVIDIAAGIITRTLSLRDCAEPTGLAFDPAGRLLVSACANGAAEILSADDGHEVARIAIGTRPDAAAFDPVRRLVFIPSGGDGMLWVISLSDQDNVKLVQQLTTRAGTRTCAVDPGTGRVYLPSGSLVPPRTPGQWPAVAPGSFAVLVVAP